MGQVFIIGDVHQNAQHFDRFSSFKNLTEKDTIICLGDFGGNFFFDSYDDRFKEALAKFNCNFFIVRGNHEARPSSCAADRPKEWDQEEFFEGNVWIEKKYPYIKYAMDYPTFYYINNHLTFVFPGAFSPDRQLRLEKHWPYFFNEQMNEYEMQKGRDLLQAFNNKCDLVLSHTCPIIFEPTHLFNNAFDQNMIDKTTERYLGEIEYQLTYKLWCWGHFHDTIIYPKTKDGKDQFMLYFDTIVKLNEYFRGMPRKYCFERT